MDNPREGAVRPIAAGPGHRLSFAGDGAAGRRPETGRALPLESLP